MSVQVDPKTVCAPHIHGECKFGDACREMHLSTATTHMPNSLGNRNLLGSLADTDQCDFELAGIAPECRSFWTQGTCPNGRGCYKLHPGGSSAGNLLVSGSLSGIPKGFTWKSNRQFPSTWQALRARDIAREADDREEAADHAVAVALSADTAPFVPSSPTASIRGLPQPATFSPAWTPTNTILGAPPSGYMPPLRHRSPSVASVTSGFSMASNAWPTLGMPMQPMMPMLASPPPMMAMMPPPLTHGFRAPAHPSLPVRPPASSIITIRKPAVKAPSVAPSTATESVLPDDTPSETAGPTVPRTAVSIAGAAKRKALGRLPPAPLKPKPPFQSRPEPPDAPLVELPQTEWTSERPTSTSPEPPAAAPTAKGKGKKRQKMSRRGSSKSLASVTHAASITLPSSSVCGSPELSDDARSTVDTPATSVDAKGASGVTIGAEEQGAHGPQTAVVFDYDMFNSAVFSEVKPAYEDDDEATSTDSDAWPPSDDERAYKASKPMSKPVSIFTKKVKPKPPVQAVKPVKWQGAGRKLEPAPNPSPPRRRSRRSSVRSKSARGSPPPSPLLGPTGLFEDDPPPAPAVAPPRTVPVEVVGWSVSPPPPPAQAESPMANGHSRAASANGVVWSENTSVYASAASVRESPEPRAEPLPIGPSTWVVGSLEALDETSIPLLGAILDTDALLARVVHALVDSSSYEAQRASSIALIRAALVCRRWAEMVEPLLFRMAAVPADETIIDLFLTRPVNRVRRLHLRTTTVIDEGYFIDVLNYARRIVSLDLNMREPATTELVSAIARTCRHLTLRGSGLVTERIADAVDRLDGLVSLELDVRRMAAYDDVPLAWASEALRALTVTGPLPRGCEPRNVLEPVAARLEHLRYVDAPWPLGRLIFERLTELEVVPSVRISTALRRGGLPALRTLRLLHSGPRSPYVRLLRSMCARRQIECIVGTA